MLDGERGKDAAAKMTPRSSKRTPRCLLLRVAFDGQGQDPLDGSAFRHSSREPPPSNAALS